MLVTILALIVVLGVLIFVHEAGHFVAAKLAGIYVHRFSLGLGPPIPWLTFRRGETEYTVSWLPLGGYVKMASREEDIANSALEGGRPTTPVPPDRVFEARPVWVRMVVILAGVTMNALFAWAAFSFLAYKNGSQIDPVTRVGRVVADSAPAAGGTAQADPARHRDRAYQWRHGALLGRDRVRHDQHARARSAASSSPKGRPSCWRFIPTRWRSGSRQPRCSSPSAPPWWGRSCPDKPAAKAGMQEGDTIVAVNGKAGPAVV